MRFTEKLQLLPLSSTKSTLDDKEYKGSLISLLENGTTFIKNNSKVKWKKTSSGREDMPDYPERAAFEALVNALIHRDYGVIGSEIHIDMYDNRLEITSPGGMFDGRKIQEVDLLHVPSSRRNPVISDIFHRLKYMERRGSGIKKILKEYEYDSLPTFFSDQQYFTIVLKNKNFDENETTQKTTQKTNDVILSLIIENPKISQSEIAEKVGNITVDGVKYHLKKLKEKGVIQRIGGDNGGHWKVKSKETKK